MNVSNKLVNQINDLTKNKKEENLKSKLGTNFNKNYKENKRVEKEISNSNISNDSIVNTLNSLSSNSNTLNNNSKNKSMHIKTTSKNKNINDTKKENVNERRIDLLDSLNNP